MRFRSIALLLLLSALFAFAAATTVDDVRAADRRRVQALLKADRAALDNILSEELVYGHADGRVQTKAQLVAALTEGKVTYLSYEGPPPEVKLAEDVAVLSGTANLTAQTQEKRVQFSLRYLAVYQRENDTWRLLAYQSAPLTRP